MGGHAVLHATRLPADHYHVAAGTCLARLRAVCGAPRRLAAIPAVRTKADFGDIDILVEHSGSKGLDRETCTQALRATEAVRNGPVLSCGVPLVTLGFAEYLEDAVVQVDLIGVSPAHFDSALAYFSWNDCGNLLGRVAHNMGLKLGHDGLSYVLRRETRVLATLPLATDWAVILPILGYDAARWQAGFDTLEDMFAFVMSGRFTDPAFFPLEHRSHKARVRDAKRPSYRAFLRYIQDHPVAHPPPLRDKPDWLPYLFAAIPGLRDRYDQAWAQDHLQQAIKTRYNGAVIGRWTGLPGPDLGQFMRVYQDHKGGLAGLAAHVAAHTNLELFTDVRAFQQAYSLNAIGRNEGGAS